MKGSLWIVVLIMAMIIGQFTISTADSCELGSFHNVEYVKNYDGDTVTVNLPSPGKQWDIFTENIGIRVKGIDTPEIRGHKERGFLYHSKAVKAKEVVRKLCEGKPIVLKNCSRGKYFRIVADVYCNGVSISEILLDKELAISYSGSGSKF